MDSTEGIAGIKCETKDSGAPRTEGANMMHILRCASGKHELSMRIDDCAYCKIESLQTALTAAQSELARLKHVAFVVANELADEREKLKAPVEGMPVEPVWESFTVDRGEGDYEELFCQYTKYLDLAAYARQVAKERDMALANIDSADAHARTWKADCESAESARDAALAERDEARNELVRNRGGEARWNAMWRRPDAPTMQQRLAIWNEKQSCEPGADWVCDRWDALYTTQLHGHYETLMRLVHEARQYDQNAAIALLADRDALRAAAKDVSKKIHDADAGRINWRVDFAEHIDKLLADAAKLAELTGREKG